MDVYSHAAFTARALEIFEPLNNIDKTAEI